MKQPWPEILTASGLVIVAFGWGSAVQQSRPREPNTQIVVMENMTFSPAVITVQPGEIVEFRNSDLVPHNVTERREQLFDSGVIRPNEVWRFSAVRKGAFNYQCIYHPEMTGLIVVGEVSESSVLATPARGVELCGDL